MTDSVHEDDEDEDDDRPFECVDCHNERYETTYITVCASCWSEREQFEQYVRELLFMPPVEGDEEDEFIIALRRKIGDYLERRWKR